MAAEQTMTFKIVTVEGVVYENDIERVTIPTTDGEVTILPMHAPMVSVLSSGALLVHHSGEVHAHAISGGMLEVRPDNAVYVMADTAERAEDIDLGKAEEARKRAEEILAKQDSAADVDFARVQAMLEREIARIDVANRYRK